MFYYKRNILSELLPDIESLILLIGTNNSEEMTKKVKNIQIKIDKHFKQIGFTARKNEYIDRNLSYIIYMLFDTIDNMNRGVLLAYTQIRLKYIVGLLQKM